MNFLQFLEAKEEKRQNKIMLNEAFKNSELGKARDLIVSLLRKKTNKLVVSLGDFDTEIGKQSFKSELFICGEVKTPMCFTFNWLDKGKSSEVYSISFYKDMSVFMTGQGKADLTIETLGSSIVYFIPIISHIIQNKDFNLSAADAKKYASNIFKGSKDVKESEYYVGALRYSIFEGLSNEVIENTFKYNVGIYESDYEDMLAWKKDKQKKAKAAYDARNESPEAKQRFKDIDAEYAEIKKAIKGGASTIEEVQLAVKKALAVKVENPKGYDKVEQEIEKASKDPDQVFKEMYKYIKMVGKGLIPSLIICGAPGVGKTWKTTHQLETMGYKEDENLYTIKGKCTTRRLYMHLYDFQDKGNIVLIDDADALVGPKADENSINILKAALDSTSSDKGRLVSYGVGGKLQDDDGNDLPKKFYYRGSVIILTNYNAGQLNTALRGRSYLQDIHFTTEQVLEIIKKLMPGIDPDKLSAKAKMKAYDYLMELNESGSKMELSLRTFGICALMFEANMNDPEFTEEDTKSMIREQMILQAARGGKSY